jgi:hypothetical protein
MRKRFGVDKPTCLQGNSAALWAALIALRNPELVATPQYAALSAAWFWRSRGLNELADAEVYQALSLRINRKLDSFPEREANRKRALEALCRSMVMDLVFATVRFGRF